ncbi:hypothetical protein [Dubosiella newyorkensis]|uniref:hypothetical protein n=1 Tax=Dubosiella newyorkensis TaxID=1862672 RepID=UPI002573812A|nr:hypothetical protein [Dubosiella newyorkensis]
MNDEQKVLFKQLQLAGLGIVIGIFGLFAKHRAIFWIGIGVLVWGIARYLLIRHFLSR